MACGTPVIVPRRLRFGDRGRQRDRVVVDDEHAMAEAIGQLDEIDPERCRGEAGRFDVATVAAAYGGPTSWSEQPSPVTSSTDNIR
jgi:hypothetical protein